MLRAAGYHSHALWVASAAGQWEWVLDVLIEDCADYDEAVAYLDTLPRQQRAQALRRHGKVRKRKGGCGSAGYKEGTASAAPQLATRLHGPVQRRQAGCLSVVSTIVE